MGTVVKYPNEKSGKGSDLFTRLNIRIWEGDNAIRPVQGQDWWDSQDNAVGYKSPDITFSRQPPIPINQPTDILIQVHNYGTMDCLDGTLEVAYNLWIGNEREGNELISVQNLPLIPAGDFVRVPVSWTPPDRNTSHACIHARVTDIYSWLNYPLRTAKWSSFENPQAGHRNVQLIRIDHPNQPLIVRFMAKNFFQDRIQAKVLVLEGSLDRRQSLSERFPLPFNINTSNIRFTATRSIHRSTNIRSKRFSSLSNTGRSGNFPTEFIDEKLVHSNYGFDLDNKIKVPRGRKKIGRDHFFTKQNIESLGKKTLNQIKLDAGEVAPINLIIPPEQFPKQRARKTFVVHYQVGKSRPVEHTIYLYR